MSKPVTVREAADMLLAADDILILTHQYPDGDTLGSAFGLCRALQKHGKRVQVACNDPIPVKYDYLLERLDMPTFEPQFICAVDVADEKLLGHSLEALAKKAMLCIDHHTSNTGYAAHLLLNSEYAAAAMAIHDVIVAMNTPFDSAMAECIYTGIATDTGCFKYSNTTAATHRMAADMMDIGIRSDMINRTMFDTKSRQRVELERMALDSIRYFYDGRCAVMVISEEMIHHSGACENDMEGLSPLPRQIEGVWVGVTMREKEDGSYKVSVRTGNHANAAAICNRLGGGGHIRAAGCALPAPFEQAMETMLSTIAATVERIDKG